MYHNLGAFKALCCAFDDSVLSSTDPVEQALSERSHTPRDHYVADHHVMMSPHVHALALFKEVDHFGVSHNLPSRRSETRQVSALFIALSLDGPRWRLTTLVMNPIGREVF